MAEAGTELDPRTVVAITAALAVERAESTVAAAIAAAIAASRGRGMPVEVRAEPLDFWSRAAMAPPWPSPVTLLRRC
ncbi:MAG: hypothetical protein HY907_04355 [Deltaproteobacteria bacterium]|nr:hypothetical protein [Deltaproteobacteria bacterium]